MTNSTQHSKINSARIESLVGKVERKNMQKMTKKITNQEEVNEQILGSLTQITKALTLMSKTLEDILESKTDENELVMNWATVPKTVVLPKHVHEVKGFVVPFSDMKNYEGFTKAQILVKDDIHKSCMDTKRKTNVDVIGITINRSQYKKNEQIVNWLAEQGYNLRSVTVFLYPESVKVYEESKKS